MEARIKKIAGRTLVLSALAVGLMGLSRPASAAPAGGGPPGNNGTIKIDSAEFDSHPDNEPHVGCKFEVDFYGFDEGDLNADVVFEAHPPTGTGTLLTDSIFIGEDDNSGGGSEVGLDAHRQYDLSPYLVGFPEQPQQGYHVKLTIHADGSQGADTKHKVFWVTGCNDPKDPDPKDPDPKDPTPKDPTTPTDPGNPQTGGDPTPQPPTVNGSTNPGAEVLAAEYSRTTTELPYTGDSTAILLGFAGITLMAGAHLLRASRQLASS